MPRIPAALSYDPASANIAQFQVPGYTGYSDSQGLCFHGPYSLSWLPAVTAFYACGGQVGVPIHLLACRMDRAHPPTKIILGIQLQLEAARPIWTSCPMGVWLLQQPGGVSYWRKHGLCTTHAGQGNQDDFS